MYKYTAVVEFKSTPMCRAVRVIQFEDEVKYIPAGAGGFSSSHIYLCMLAQERAKEAFEFLFTVPDDWSANCLYLFEGHLNILVAKERVG